MKAKDIPLGMRSDVEDNMERELKDDEEISAKEVFARWLEWNGIVGWTDAIIRAYETTVGTENKR